VGKSFLIFILIVVVISIGLLLFYQPKPNLKPEDFIEIGQTKVFVEIAQSDKEKALGLSGRNSLAQNQGMIFLFNEKRVPAFWMKDMNFNLDFIWLDGNMVVDVTENVIKPEKGISQSQLTLYRPNKPITALLEVNSGFIKRNKIKIGDPVSFYLK
jgi:uncharacterized membrane protein (UPF0127 family)